MFGWREAKFLLTPPYGFALFYMRAVAPKGTVMVEIYRAAFPFIGLQALGLIMTMAFPQLALWLPHLMIKVKHHHAERGGFSQPHIITEATTPSELRSERIHPRRRAAWFSADFYNGYGFN